MKRVINEAIPIQSKDGRVIGVYLPDGKVKVFKGSFFRNVEVNSLRQNVRNERLFLLNNDYISNYQLNKDYTFDNPSIAISALMGHMETGNQAFVTMDNIELGAYLEIDRIDSFEQSYKLADLISDLKKDRVNNMDFKKLIDEDDSNGYVSTEDINQIIDIKAEYIPVAKPDRTRGDINSYKRNFEKAKKSILLAKYKCDLNERHESFIMKNGKPYMEAHHLIPLSAQDYFDFSLDVDANIVCLCPNCHRKLHYGENISDDLRMIYLARIDRLIESGIYISFDELLELYK